MKPDLDLASRVMLSTPSARHEQIEAFLHASCQAVIYHALASETRSARLPMLLQLASFTSVPTLRRAQTRSTHIPVSMCERWIKQLLSALPSWTRFYISVCRAASWVGSRLTSPGLSLLSFRPAIALHIEVAIKIPMQGKPRLHPMGSRSSDGCTK